MSQIGFKWHDTDLTNADAERVQPLPVAESTPSDELKVCAVFSSFNRCKVALRCLDRLLGQTRQLFRIIVADNASTDETVQEIRGKYAGNPQIDLLVLPKNLGNSGGVRLAMQRALEQGAHAVWILDDDSWPRPDALENLLKHYRLNQVFSSLVFDPEHQDISWPYMVKNPCDYHFVNTMSNLPQEEVFEIRGAWLGALVSRQILETAGLPDERLFIRGEDEEFPLRIKKMGHCFFCVKNSVLEHPSPAKLVRLHLFGFNFFYEPRLAMWKAYYIIRNRVFIYRTYSDSWIGGVTKAAGFILLAIAMAMLLDDHKFKRLLVYLRAGWNGMTNRLKIEPL